MKDRILGLQKNVFFLGLTSLFNDFSSEMVFAVFPAFFISVLKAGAASLGLVDGIAESISDFFKIYSGNLADRFQKRKPLIVAGYILAVITRPFYIVFQTVAGALGLRVLDRLGKGFRDPPRDAVISLSVPKEELGKSFGYHRAMDTTGAILGPLVAYLLLRAYPLKFNAVFLSAFAVGIIAILSLFFVSDIATNFAAKRHDFAASWRGLSGSFKIFIFAIFILSIGSLPVAVVLLKTQSIVLVIADIPLFYMIYNLSYAAFSLPAGKMSDRIGAPSVIVIGYLLLLASYVVIARVASPWMLAGGFLLFGLFPGLTDGVQRSLASQLSGDEFRGSALGFLNAAYGFGALIAGVLGGILWQVYGSGIAFIGAACIVVIGLILFILSVKKPSHDAVARG
jgi:MFS family permease